MTPTCPTCGVDILVHPAGRCLDIWIAEKVMGWHIAVKDGWQFFESSDGQYMAGISQDETGCYEDEEDFHIIHWHPSKSILWAWEVVEKLRSMEAWLSLSILPNHKTWDFRGVIHEREKDEIRFIEFADTAPLAICRAAILAMEEK